MKENILIAEFMYMRADPIDKSVMIKMTTQGNEVVPVESLNYHNSWDWLMPVVERIETFGFEFIISENRVKIKHNTDHSIEEFGLTIGSKLNTTYHAVVEFIKTIKIKTESNELIAEFMDMEDHQEMGKYVTPNYHNSWDWLMPVVSECRVQSNSEDSHWEEIYYTLEECNLNTTYKAVVEFIKQFNK